MEFFINIRSIKNIFIIGSLCLAQQIQAASDCFDQGNEYKLIIADPDKDQETTYFFTITKNTDGAFTASIIAEKSSEIEGKIQDNNIYFNINESKLKIYKFSGVCSPGVIEGSLDVNGLNVEGKSFKITPMPVIKRLIVD